MQLKEERSTIGHSFDTVQGQPLESSTAKIQSREIIHREKVKQVAVSKNSG